MVLSLGIVFKSWPATWTVFFQKYLYHFYYINFVLKVDCHLYIQMLTLSCEDLEFILGGCSERTR